MTIKTVQLGDDSAETHLVHESGVSLEVFGNRGNDRIFIVGSVEDVVGFYADVGEVHGGPGADYLSSAGLVDTGSATWIWTIALDGGEGIDTMVGGSGRELFTVNRQEDVVIDSGVRDHDSVHAMGLAFYQLPPNVENLALSGWNAAGACVGRGNELRNVISGSDDGNDVLEGLAGNDHLIGSFGVDTLVGGMGKDRLWAPSKAVGDMTTFDYNKVGDSCVRFGIDQLVKIGSPDNYRIDLSDIDANRATLKVDEEFTFIGQAAFGSDATGQIRVEQHGEGWLICASNDADSFAEIQIELRAPFSPELGNFVL